MALRFKTAASIVIRVTPQDQFCDYWAILSENLSLMAHDYTAEAAVNKLHRLLEAEIERLKTSEHLLSAHDLHRWHYLKEVFEVD